MSLVEGRSNSRSALRVSDDAGWTAVVLAGQRPGVDPLAEEGGTWAKALVRVGGEAMLSRVARTLLDVEAIDRIVVLTQDPDRMRADESVAWMKHHSRIRFEQSGDGISRSLIAMAGKGDAAWPLLVTTADHPLLTPAVVRSFLARSDSGDLCVGMVERRTLLARYPQNRRTWLRFRGGAYTGANLFALRTPNVEPLLRLWSGVEQNRKKGWRILASFGPALLLRTLTRTISLEAAMAAAGRDFQVIARPVLLDEAEAGIDVDKPSDRLLAETILARRARSGR